MVKKLKENQFYCVTCRQKRTCHRDNMCVTTYKNSRVKDGKVHALKGNCPSCDQSLTRWISKNAYAPLVIKYGKC